MKLAKAGAAGSKSFGSKGYRSVGWRGFRQENSRMCSENPFLIENLVPSSEKPLQQKVMSTMSACRSKSAMVATMFGMRHEYFIRCVKSLWEACEWTNGFKIGSSGYSVARYHCYRGGKHWSSMQRCDAKHTRCSN